MQYIKGPFLGIDYGTRRVGIAISDPEGTVAFPRELIEIESGNLKALVSKIKAFVLKEQIQKVIVGWPLSLQGHPTQQTRLTETFMRELKKTLPIEVVAFDERLTTVQAKRTGGDDAVAAQILLQTYLGRTRREH